MKEYTSENPVFYDKISIVERADLVNNQNKNESEKQLLQNTLVLKKQLDACLGENGKDGKLDLADGIKADNLVGAVNEVFMFGSKIKKELADNLTAIGIISSAEEPMEQLLGKVLDAVDTSGDTVTGTVLLTGYTAHDSAGGQITGSMANNGAWIGNTTGPDNVAIPEGYHNGGGYVGGRGAYDKGVADADARTNPDSANYKSGYGAGVSSLNGTINDLNGQIASQNNAIDSLNGQIASKNNIINGLNGQLNVANETIDSLNQQLESAKQNKLSGDTETDGFSFSGYVQDTVTVSETINNSGDMTRAKTRYAFDNSKLRFRYAKVTAYNVSFWDNGEAGVYINDNNAFCRHKVSNRHPQEWNPQEPWVIDLGSNPAGTITVEAYVQNNQIVGGTNMSFTVTLWGQQL